MRNADVDYYCLCDVVRPPTAIHIFTPMLIAARCGLVPIYCLRLINVIAMERLYIMI